MVEKGSSETILLVEEVLKKTLKAYIKQIDLRSVYRYQRLKIIKKKVEEEGIFPNDSPELTLWFSICLSPDSGTFKGTFYVIPRVNDLFELPTQFCKLSLYIFPLKYCKHF